MSKRLDGDIKAAKRKPLLVGEKPIVMLYAVTFNMPTSYSIMSGRNPLLYCTPLLSTCPLHTDSRCGKERRILIGP